MRKRTPKSTTTPIEDAWRDSVGLIAHPQTPAWQIEHMRSIFFLGAITVGGYLENGGDLEVVGREIDEFQKMADERAALETMRPAGSA